MRSVKYIRFVNLTSEKPKEIYNFLQKSFTSSYKDFLLRHFKYPKFRKGLFFLLKRNNKIISTFACRETKIFESKVNTALFGDVATLPKFREKGYMRLLIYNALKKLQEKQDIILNPWVARKIYKKMYSKFGFSLVKLRTTREFRKDLRQNKEKKILSASYLYKIRKQARKERKIKRIIMVLICYLQFIFYSLYSTISSKPKVCNIKRVKKLEKSRIVELDRLYVEYCSQHAKNFFERDKKIWHFLHAHKDIYIIKDRELEGYAIVSSSKSNFIIEEIFTRNLSTYFYAILYFEKIAKKLDKETIIIYSDRFHTSIVKYGYIPITIVPTLPFDPRGATTLRLLRNFFKKISIQDCELHITDTFLNSYIKIGESNFKIYSTQKNITDLITNGNILRILFRVKIKPWYRILKAYHILSEIKNKYGINDSFRTYADRY